MKELVYMIAMIIIAITNSEVNIEEIVESPSIQLEEKVELGDFFAFYDGTMFYYKENDQEAFDIVLSMLRELPENVKIGAAEIHFEGKNGNIAGSTSGTTITLYDFLSYDEETQRHILYHEVAHTYGNILWSKNLIDIDYSEYAEAVKKDKNYLSDYSKSKIKEENNYSEDFADGFSEYFRNYKSFKRKHKNRFEYLERFIKEDFENGKEK